MKQLPRQAEQSGRDFLGGLDVGFGRACFERRVNMDGETAAGVIADLRPGLHDVRGVDQRHRRLVQELPPLHEVRLHLARPVLVIRGRPDGILLQIPAQVFCLDRPDGRDEAPVLRAVDVRLARRGRLIDQPGAGGGAAHAVLLVEFQVGELKDEFLQRLGLGLGRGSDVGGIAIAQRDEDRVHRRLDAARVAGHGDVDRFLAEELFQHAELGAVQRERDDGELVLAAFFAQFERVAQFHADPFRLQRIRADHDREGRRGFDGPLDFHPERIAAAQLARIDPAGLAVIGERRAEFAHEAVVLRAVGDEEFAHRCLDAILQPEVPSRHRLRMEQKRSGAPGSAGHEREVEGV